MKLLVATTNPGKVREFREMLGSDRFEWVGLGDRSPVVPVEETGHTFRANAILKATTFAKLSGLWTLADDSGLEVDALDKKPGIHSARWAQLNKAGIGDADNNALLLKQLAQVPEEKRSGRFVCVLALADPSGKLVLTTRATMEGSISFTPAGQNGFGYDPLFRIAGLTQTSAEISSEEKHRISHRGQALRRMKSLMSDITF